MRWHYPLFCLLATSVFAEERNSSSSGGYSIHPTEWIKGPDGLLYQFHIGPQSWILAREYCRAKNADLVTIRDKDQLEWLLSHYSPFHIGNDRTIQIGLSKSKENKWIWVDGADFNGEIVKFDAESDGKCAQLRIHDEQLDTVDCEITSHQTRFICERTQKTHVEQQRSENYIWSKLEALFSYFGIGGPQKTDAEKKKESEDYFDQLEKASDKAFEGSSTPAMTSEEKFNLASEKVNKTKDEEEDDSVESTLDLLSKVPSVLVEKQRRPENNSTEEGSGAEHPEVKENKKSEEKPVKALKELIEHEGSGVETEKSLIEKESILIDDPDKLEKMINTMEKMIENMEKIEVVTPKKEGGAKIAGVKTNTISDDLEDDFDEEKNKDMPVSEITPPPLKEEKEEDCDEDEKSSDIEGSGLYQMPKISSEREKDVKQFLLVLKKFLARAEHDDLRRLLDDQSGRSLLERMQQAVKDANEREFRRMEYMMTVGKFKQFDAEHGMSENEQNEMFKKISAVVIQAAKKEGILVTATEPSARTTASDKGLEKKKESGERKDDIKVTVIDMTGEKNKEEELKESELLEKPSGTRTTVTESSPTTKTPKVEEEVNKSAEKQDEQKSVEVTTTTEAATPVTELEPAVGFIVPTEKKEEPKTEEITSTTSTTTEAPSTTTTVKKETVVPKKHEKEPNLHKNKTDKITKKKEIPENEDYDNDSRPITKTTTAKPLRRTTRKPALSRAGSSNPLGLPTFAPLPTFATFPTPAPAKIPSLEEVLEKLGSQFKMLLQPPKPLALPKKA